MGAPLRRRTAPLVPPDDVPLPPRGTGILEVNVGFCQPTSAPQERNDQIIRDGNMADGWSAVDT